jgi:hypothetical protein
MDNKIRVFVVNFKGERRQIGSDRIAFWHLRESSLKSMLSMLEARSA